MADDRIRLRPAARRDLERIWDWSAKYWSREQADRYVERLHGAMARLASTPGIARLRHELQPPVRVYLEGVHAIVFVEIQAGIEVLRVRHGREDWAGDPGSDDGAER